MSAERPSPDAAANREAPKKISVLVPAYGTASYIAETLQSALGQTVSDCEVIVINDGDPETAALEAAIAPYRDRIVYLSKPNGGLASARNFGLRTARGRYVALLDSDDIWEPAFLEQLLARMESDPKIGLVFPNATFFGSGGLVGKHYYELFPKPALEAGQISLQRLLRREIYIFGSLLLRRESLDSAGSFDEGLRASEDYDMWLRLAKAGVHFSYVDQPLVRYRIRETSLSADATGLYRSLCQVYKKMIGAPDLSPGEQEAARAGLAESEALIALFTGRRAVLEGDWATAIRDLEASNRHFHTRKVAWIVGLLRLWPDVFGVAARWYMRRRG